MKTAVYVLVALAAAAGGFAIYRFGIAPSEMPPAAQTMAVTPATERAMPATLPEFSLLDREGELRAISSWPGRSMIVNFWATWCAPCRREIPLLNELQRTHGEAGFQVVGVAVDIREDVLAYADEIGIDYPILIGEQEALDAINLFGLESVGFPFTVFTDDQARIVLYHLGELKARQAEVILAAVQQVNRGELTPEAARAVAAKQLSELPEDEAS